LDLEFVFGKTGRDCRDRKSIKGWRRNERRTLVEVADTLARVAVSLSRPLVPHEPLDPVERLDPLLRRGLIDERVFEVDDGGVVLLCDGFDGGDDGRGRGDGGALLLEGVLGRFLLENAL
jgi:hypothetical protein